MAGSVGAARLRRLYVLSTLPYPLWHLLAPAGARDPWIVWWLVAAYFSLVALASPWLPFVERRLLAFFQVGSALVTLQLFALASANEMEPFYAVGSVMAVVVTLIAIRTIPSLLAYTTFCAAAGVALYAMAPDGRKLAYWGGLLPAVGFYHHRLRLQIAAGRRRCDERAELERRVAERTADYADANRRLHREMERRDRLEAVLLDSRKLEAVGRLAGGLAHDFNNLLTAIRIHADLIHGALPDGSQPREDAAQIIRACRRASALVQKLLVFSRGGDARMRLVDLREVIEEMTLTLERLVGEDTRFSLDLDPAPQTIRANREQLEQVLLNLALNARDAMPRGGSFSIETRVLRRGELEIAQIDGSLDADEYVLLAATDTGIGMDTPTRERAFDPFFSRKAAGEGTGLGLSMIYGIVRQAGGQVQLASEPGKGARFELYWPRMRETAPPSPSAPA